MNVELVDDSQVGINIAKRAIYKEEGPATALFISGGKTPKPLYERLASEGTLNVGAVGMMDDRYSFHMQYSNIYMIEESGLPKYLEKNNIPFYKILEFGINKMETARQYNETVSFILNHFKRNIGILGIGEDGHIASIPVGVPHKNQNYVEEYSNFPIAPPDRITLTFAALSMFDLLIVLAFGEEKRNALLEMLKEGSEEEIPARFLNRKEIEEKTLLITDQKL